MDKKITAEQLKKTLRERPDEFNMHTWGKLTPCGTVCCIAGWTMILAGYELRQRHSATDELNFFRENGERVENESSEALELLGLEKVDLFYLHAWPSVLRPSHFISQKEQVENACTAIDYFFHEEAVEA